MQTKKEYFEKKMQRELEEMRNSSEEMQREEMFRILEEKQKELEETQREEMRKRLEEMRIPRCWRPFIEEEHSKLAEEEINAHTWRVLNDPPIAYMGELLPYEKYSIDGQIEPLPELEELEHILP